MLGRFEQAISELPCASVSKRVLMQSVSYENEFDLHENELVGGTHFHLNGFAGNSKMTHIGRGAAHLEDRSSDVVLPMTPFPNPTCPGSRDELVDDW